MQPINAHSTRAHKRGADREARGGRITKPPRLIAAAPPRDASGRLEVLQAQGTIDADEVFGEQEKALSEFLRLHPMLSVRDASNPLCRTRAVDRFGARSWNRPRTARCSW